MNESKFKGRTITLDLASDKRSFEELKQKLGDKTEETQEKNEITQPIEEENETKAINNKEKKTNTKKKAKVPEPKKAMEIETEVQGDKKDLNEKPNNIRNKPNEEEDLSCSVFVRNISYDVTEKDFRDYFKQFGVIKLAKVIINFQI